MVHRKDKKVRSRKIQIGRINHPDTYGSFGVHGTTHRLRSGKLLTRIIEGRRRDPVG